MQNTGFKRRQRKGFYINLRDIRCDCGLPATRQVQVVQLRANGNEMTSVIPLCEDCYQMMAAEDRGILQAA